jgi:hypothetical protein
LQLAFVIRPARGEVGVGFKIDDGPDAVLEKSQIQHCFDQAAVFEPSQQRQFAMAAGGGTSTRQPGMSKGRGGGCAGRLNFVNGSARGSGVNTR